MRPEAVYGTRLGRMYVGDCKELLASYPITRRKEGVQLIFTSPPFVLNRKKSYGNLEGEEYVEWFSSLAPTFSEYLRPDGSIVIELGNAWEPGEPSMSTLAIESLLAFKKAGNFKLCQEFINFNPAKLPSPAQWVTVERIRVKDAFTRIWWLSKTSRPAADNRRILTRYSDSMEKLLKRGTYNSGKRPSEHNIGDTSFLANNGGSIPPNVLVPAIADLIHDLSAEICNLLPIANTLSQDSYQEYCRESGIAPHPARMPRRLAEFFIEFLTERGDLVLDPFAGSNTTGIAAEELGRRWIALEEDDVYARTSSTRFEKERQARVI